MKGASYAPGQCGSVQFAISADDCLLHFEVDRLTAKQRADDTANKDLIAMLQCASQFIARPGDRVALYEGFNAHPWLETLARYQGFFTELGLDPAPTSAQSFRPREGFYDAFADRPAHTDQLTVSDVCLADGRRGTRGFPRGAGSRVAGGGPGCHGRDRVAGVSARGRLRHSGRWHISPARYGACKTFRRAGFGAHRPRLRRPSRLSCTITSRQCIDALRGSADARADQN